MRYHYENFKKLWYLFVIKLSIHDEDISTIRNSPQHPTKIMVELYATQIINNSRGRTGPDPSPGLLQIGIPLISGQIITLVRKFVVMIHERTISFIKKCFQNIRFRPFRSFLCSRNHAFRLFL